MTWSETFNAYIHKRFGEKPQEKAARSLRVAASSVSYWCRGALAREKMRKRIQGWSRGAVPADLHVAATRPSHPPRSGKAA